MFRTILSAAAIIATTEAVKLRTEAEAEFDGRVKEALCDIETGYNMLTKEAVDSGDIGIEEVEGAILGFLGKFKIKEEDMNREAIK